MKFLMLIAVLLLTLTACATGPRLSDEQRLTLYREHAGEQVDSFHYFGSINNWMPLGNSAVAVWVHPQKAYLLELFGPCSGLEHTLAIAITQQFGRVSAGFDRVIVADPGYNISCRIESIRPIDVDALDTAMDSLREQVEMVEREKTSGTTSDASTD